MALKTVVRSDGSEMQITPSKVTRPSARITTAPGIRSITNHPSCASNASAAGS